MPAFLLAQSKRRIAVDINRALASIDVYGKGHGIFSLRFRSNGRRRPNELEGDVDVATRRFRVRTEPFVLLYEKLGDVGVETWQTDVETSAQVVFVVGEVPIDFRVDNEIEQLDFPSA